MALVLYIITGICLITGILVGWLYLRYLKCLRLIEKARHDQPSPHDGPDVIIVGAGVVGSVMATVLARDGRRVTIIERSMKPPYRIAGEALYTGGTRALKELGINLRAEDVDGMTIDKLHMFDPQGGEKTFIVQPGTITADNGKLVENLRSLFQAEQKCHVTEGTVSRLCLEGDVVTGVEYRVGGVSDYKTLKAPLTILADGANSRLRSINVPRKAVHCCYNLAIEVDCQTEHHIAGIPTSLGFIVVYPLSPKRLRFLHNSLKNFSKSDYMRIESEFPEKYRELFKRALEGSTIRSLPVLYLPPAMKHVPGIISVGDAFSIRNAIGASGMMVGIRDVLTWRDLLHNIPDLYNYEAMWAAENMFAVRRKSYCFVTDLLSWCLRQFFLPESEGLKLVGPAFGEHMFQLKKQYPDMLSGLETRPWLLLYHLCIVVKVAMVTAVSSGGLIALPLGLYKAGLAFCSASATIIPHVIIQIRSMLVLK